MPHPGIPLDEHKCASNSPLQTLHNLLRRSLQRLLASTAAEPTTDSQSRHAPTLTATYCHPPERHESNMHYSKYRTVRAVVWCYQTETPPFTILPCHAFESFF